jgi:hypothetical protein
LNFSQAIVVALAAANIVLMLLFPPYDSMVIGRGASSFDAFYFVFDRQHNKMVNTDLLFLQLGWVVMNASLGWMVLRNHQAASAIVSRRTGVAIFVILNLALILLFPPFENYASSARFSGTYFDSFYFIFGDKWQRQIYVPLLYLEILCVLVNGALLWLLFRDAPGEQPSSHPPTA